MNATITITLPADLAQVVSAKATASGQGVEEYTLTVLQKDAGLPSLRDLFADVRTQIQANGISDEELENDIDAAVAEVRARRRAK
jgi:hypothetical protein